MNIRQAGSADLDVVKRIASETIHAIYPHYYPTGAVDYFLSYHNEGNIISDINLSRVFLLENKGKAIGTVTIKDNEICRLFVLPTFQRHGYGRELIDYSEQLIAKDHRKIKLDASFPAKTIYLNRGYRETGSYSILTENGDCLCYDVMEKQVSSLHDELYDGKIFVPKYNSNNGEVNENTVFHYHQNDQMLWGEYSGGDIVRGHLIGTISNDNSINFYYHHINTNAQVKIGKCYSTPHVLPNGKIELHEEWQWLDGDKSAGTSVLIER